MDGTDIAAMITAAGVVLGVIGAGIKWLVELVLAQSRLTITELREENKELEAENRALKSGKEGSA
jgi:cell division protein FtsB